MRMAARTRTSGIDSLSAKRRTDLRATAGDMSAGQPPTKSSANLTAGLRSKNLRDRCTGYQRPIYRSSGMSEWGQSPSCHSSAGCRRGMQTIPSLLLLPIVTCKTGLTHTTLCVFCEHRRLRPVDLQVVSNSTHRLRYRAPAVLTAVDSCQTCILPLAIFVAIYGSPETQKLVLTFG